MAAALSFGEELEARGYGHRPCSFDGFREVYHLETGYVVGQYEAHRAIAGAEAHALNLAKAAQS